MSTEKNKTQTTVAYSEKEFYELLKCSGTEVTNLIFPNDDVTWVSWKYSEDNVAAGKNVNVAVAAYVTIQARLKYKSTWVNWGSLCCTVIHTRPSFFRRIMNSKLKQGNIWTTSLTIWRSRALFPLWKSLWWVAGKTMRFRDFAPRPENVQQNVKWTL